MDELLETAGLGSRELYMVFNQKRLIFQCFLVSYFINGLLQLVNLKIAAALLQKERARGVLLITIFVSILNFYLHMW